MVSAAVALNRKWLETRLSRIDVANFARLAWAADAFSSGREEAARRVVRVLPGAVDPRTGAPYQIYRWDIETLVNLYLMAPLQLPRHGRMISYRGDDYQNIVGMVGLLRNLENAEAKAYLGRMNVLLEMHRIGQRQFHWQRGYFNQAHFYRSMYIFGKGLCADRFQEKNGVSPQDLQLVSFAIRGALEERPFVSAKPDLTAFGLSPETVRRSMLLLALPGKELAGLAVKKQLKGYPTAYQPSVLREFPLILIDDVCAGPIGELVTLRSTSGLYYDLVAMGGDVRSEIGRNFEAYSLQYLEAILRDLTPHEQHRYGNRGFTFDTPDLLVKRGRQTTIVIECKSSKLTFSAQFSEDPGRSAARNYSEIARGVFQIWRFLSHIRRGISAETIVDDPALMVLTLDAWGETSRELIEGIYADARRQAQESDPEILDEDCPPVSVCPINELENVAQQTTSEQLVQVIRSACEDRFLGWTLSNVMRNIHSERPPFLHYPLLARLPEVLPWWATFDRMADSGELADAN